MAGMPAQYCPMIAWDTTASHPTAARNKQYIHRHSGPRAPLLHTYSYTPNAPAAVAVGGSPGDVRPFFC